MSQKTGELFAIYVEGETKTGKGAASAAVTSVLKDKGVSVYYDVAGDFFRRFVAIIRLELGLSDVDVLPPSGELTVTASKLYQNGKAFDVDFELGDLQRLAISQSVSLLGELPIAQQAASDWYSQSVKKAVESGAKVLVLDGRNPRRHVEGHVKIQNVDVVTILDIYMTCDAEVAAERVLLCEGITNPSLDQIQTIVSNITHRRELDRTRAEWPFVQPAHSINYIPGNRSADEVIAESRKSSSVIPITLDNSVVSRLVLEQSLAELTIAALEAL